MDLLTAIKEKRKQQPLSTVKEVTLSNGATIEVKRIGFMERKKCQIDAYKKLNIPMTDDFKPKLEEISFGELQEIELASNIELIKASCPQFSDKKILKEFGYKNAYDFMNGELEEEDFDLLSNEIDAFTTVQKAESEAVEEIKNS